MKVIISHDVDHLTVFEHLNDLIIPKFWIRNSIELGFGYISFREFLLRLKEFTRNKWNHIEELMDFDKDNNIPSTFFFGVSKGLGLSYSLELAKKYIQLVLSKGFDVGVHGIEFQNLKKIKQEFEIFKKISGLKTFGIRMHYLRMDENTLEKLAEVGYLFDSSLYSRENPFKVKNMWEFPLHIMDVFIINQRRKWQSLKLEDAIDITKREIESLYKKEIKYLTILFHDRYFSEAFKTWKEWYIQIIEFLKANGFEFISYREAINELEGVTK